MLRSSLSLLSATFLLMTIALLPLAPRAIAKPLEESYSRSIPDQKTFDRLQRTYHRGAFADVPAVLFIVDRRHHAIFFAHSPSFDFHPTFARALKLTKAGNRQFFFENYLPEDRPMILGTLAYYPTVKKLVFEFSEADHMTPALVQETFDALKKAVFSPVSFKPTTLAQEDLLQKLPAMPFVLRDAVGNPRDREVFRPGQATGQLKFVAPGTDENLDIDLAPASIAVFDLPPVHVNPVRAIITSQPSSPLSHVHMLARSWKVPDVMIRGAAIDLKQLAGTWVTLIATAPDQVTVRAATAGEIKSAEVEGAHAPIVPRADDTFRDLTDLGAQTRANVDRFGAKSANLGTVMRVKGVQVPPGFSIPLVHYREFFAASGAAAMARRLVSDPEFQASPGVRKRQLEALRDLMQKAAFEPKLGEMILAKAHREFGGRGVFARSSTNAEDLPGFNGAGLYTSVPNVKGDQALLEAVKTVWASLWNFEAYEARTAAAIDHFAVEAGVLIQLGVNAESAGVLITKNPFAADDGDSVYINAKRGLGMKVVDGKSVPEQILFRQRKNSAIVLSRSEEPTYLTFADHGGLKEVAISSPAPGAAPSNDLRVLSDGLVRQLVKNALAIRRAFGGVNQDIEWTVEKGQVWIVQSRPYVE